MVVEEAAAIAARIVAEYVALFPGDPPETVDGLPLAAYPDRDGLPTEPELARRAALRAYLDWVVAGRYHWRAMVTRGVSADLADIERAKRARYLAQKRVWAVAAGEVAPEAPPPAARKKAKAPQQAGLFGDMFGGLFG